ncbi:cholinesterase 1-like [Anneissia japonica]|uniref:cholinesterase 1-like n=1 Tax=Anneissia japonica TaxID=1529436 RepID=UPI001425B97F|nr:cholinesterase 1-like [Anneissia japonica]
MRRVILLCFLTFIKFSLTLSNRPSVTIKLGEILGVRESFNNLDLGVNATLDIFRGIPFAQPPVGENRFRRTVPLTDPWNKPLDASEFNNVCPQTSSDFDMPNNKSEDCLYLNIWAPYPRSEPLPVMFWIHGGGFIAGYGSSYTYNARPLASYNNVIMVSTNYRLGAFGFLATGDEALPGNYGLFDQAEALKFVYENIAAFGGDPNKITIYGESAGGASVGHHLISPISQDFFSQAILQSGSAVAPWGLEKDMEKARRDADQLAFFTGCGAAKSSAEMADCLRDVDQRNITLSQNTVIALTTNVIPFVPVIDNVFIPGDPYTLIKNGKFKKCKLMVGTCRDEGTLVAARAFLPQIPVKEPIVRRRNFRNTLEGYIYASDETAVVDAVELQYTDWSVADDPDTNYFYNFVDMNTDEAFLCPSDFTARAHAQSAQDVWMYQLTYLPSNSVWFDRPAWKGVAHAEDLQYVFGYHFIPELNHTFYNGQEEIELSKRMMKFWGNFAKTGNPNLETLSDTSRETFEPWLPYSVPGLDYKIFNTNMTNSKALRAEYCSFWNNYIPRLMTYTADIDDLQKQWREDYYEWKDTSMPDWSATFEDYKQNMNTCN